MNNKFIGNFIGAGISSLCQAAMIVYFQPTGILAIAGIILAYYAVPTLIALMFPAFVTWVNKQ